MKYLIFVAVTLIFLFSGCSSYYSYESDEDSYSTSLGMVGPDNITDFHPLGLIYTHIIFPLDVNLDEDQFVRRPEKGDVKHIQYYIEVMWDSNAIGDIAKENGIEQVYYADLEVLNVLGIWRQYTVHIYGT